MGQSMKKLTTGKDDGQIDTKIGEIAVKNYDKIAEETKNWGTDKLEMGDFYHAVCRTVEEINNELGGTQFCAPGVQDLEEAFKNHHKEGSVITKDEFKTIMQKLVFKTGFLGSGAKDIVFNIFGVPVTALFIKNMVMPNAIPNDIFIPAVTSATVYALAKLNKL